MRKIYLYSVTHVPYFFVRSIRIFLHLNLASCNPLVVSSSELILECQKVEKYGVQSHFYTAREKNLCAKTTKFDQIFI